MILETLLTDLLMHALVEPLNDGVLHLAHPLQISEVFFELVAVRSHALQPVVVTNVFLVWELVKEAWLPGY